MKIRYISGALFTLALAASGLFALQQLTAAQLVRQGRLDEALAVFQAAVAASPQSVAANNGVGVVLDLMGRYAEARQYLAQAIKASPNSIGTRRGTARHGCFLWIYGGLQGRGKI